MAVASGSTWFKCANKAHSLGWLAEGYNWAACCRRAWGGRPTSHRHFGFEVRARRAGICSSSSLVARAFCVAGLRA